MAFKKLCRRARTYGTCLVLFLPYLLPPVLPAVLVYAVSAKLMTEGGFKKIAIGLPSEETLSNYLHDGSIVGQEMNARYFVLTSLIVLLVASTAATATALFVLCQNFQPLRKHEAPNTAARKLTAALMILALALGLALVWWMHDPQFHLYVGKDVFPTLVRLYFKGHEGFDETFIIRTLPRIVSTLSLIPAICIVACGGTFLFRYRQATRRSDLTYDEVRSYALERLARLKMLLSASSALFAAAVLYGKAYLAWPASVMKKEGPIRDQYLAAVEGFTTYEGVRFALVLFALLSCMYLAARWSALRLAATEKEKLLAEPGLTFNIPQTMQSIATVIAPLLVGPVADVLKSIAQP